jgi:hypothetical protein
VSKFPQLLFLLAFALQARAALPVAGPVNEAAHAFSEAKPASQFVAIPEPGVFVALISGATILLARRRR